MCNNTSLEDSKPDCYICGNMDSDNECKEHAEMMEELRIVNNV